MISRIDPFDVSPLLSLTLMRTLKGTSAVIKKRSVFLALAISVLASTLASGMPRAEKHEVRHQIEQLEDAWRNAVLHGNFSAMDGLLADDYMAITPSGILQSKEQALAALRSGAMRFSSLDLSDRKIRLYGTTALVTSRAEVKGTGSEGNMSGSYRYTRVYVRDARGVWRIVSFEASRIREPGERRSSKSE
ncbi:MAG TPA: nuclear transport factor 2 family protein [Terracidiphilus sp.]|nr:nuclear transport factor 2 family protein [Terracidiphilus sp.]